MYKVNNLSHLLATPPPSTSIKCTESQSLEHHSDALAPSNARRSDGELPCHPARSKTVREAAHDAAAGRSRGVPERNCPAQDVRFLAIEAKRLFNCEVLSRKRFIDLSNKKTSNGPTNLHHCDVINFL
jgi:hypothetical protein